MEYKWYVITGAPNSGKTTVLNELSKIGFITIQEESRTFIDREIAKGKPLEEIRKNEAEFQKILLKNKIDKEKELPENKIAFFDRAVPDSIAYYEICGLDTIELIKLCKNRKYKKVFLFEMLPYKKDYARVEDEKLAIRLEKLLHKAYSDLGYEVIIVPVMPIEDRVKFVLSKM